MIELVGSYASNLAASQSKAGESAASKQSGGNGNGFGQVNDKVNVTLNYDAGTKLIEMVDPATGNVIRQIPTAATMALREMQNQFVDSPDFNVGEAVSNVVEGLQGQGEGLSNETLSPLLEELLNKSLADLESERVRKAQIAAYFSDIAPGAFFSRSV